MVHTAPGRFERWARYRRLIRKVHTHLAAGGRVTIGTYTKATTYDRRHLDLFTATPTGAWVRHGKRFDDFSHSAVIYH